MLVRHALQNELDFIRSQRVEAYSEYAKILPTDHWIALRKAISSDTDTQPGVELLVAEIDGQIVGSVALFPPNLNAYGELLGELDYSEIRMLAVSPIVRGKGVASTLIKECIKRTREKGYTSIGLHTGEFMKTAIKLYKQFGFTRLPEQDFEPANDGIIVKAFYLSLSE